MLKFVKRKYPLKELGRINRLTADLTNERQRNDDLESAVVELGTLFAEQDDALVELGELIAGEEE